MVNRDVAAARVAAVRVVGIGASAGGLDAFIDLISAIPNGTGLAFVLIQHLDPRHDSMLVDILAGATTMTVQQVTDGMDIEEDHVYVIPPDAEMTIEGDVLHLQPRPSTIPRRPLDTFFTSLASERKGDAIGVVLSGNDADGAAGLRAIHVAGGITFTQSPESAKFDVMPRAAAASADFVLPPAAIAAQMTSIAARATVEIGEQSEPDFERIFQLLRALHPVDFSHFKRATVERRIMRRVLLGNHAGLASYADSLEDDGAAVDALYHDLLIGVTSFFREPARFDALKTIVFPAIVSERSAEQSVRIWVAGCSTGEEVYSVGITLLELLEGRDDVPRIAIYGTDINEQSLRKARAAFYPQRAVAGLSAERLARYFTVVPGGYKVAKELRELCVFAAHDVTRDPPYSKIDLVTCCNVLIYFDPELQKKAVDLLQYALAPGGFLMLGSSENLRATTNQLTTVSTKPLLYRKRQANGGQATLEVIPRALHASLTASPAVPAARRVENSAGDDRRSISFEVIPFGVPSPRHDHGWIVFQNSPGASIRKGEKDGGQSEVESLRQALAAAIGEREQVADEAAAAAEEAQSSDEELRSTNEELETAKEELQSANEELSTLNEELRLRNTTLVRMNDDIENVLGAVEIPILFVGIDMTVRRFNVTAGMLLNLRADAVGRPLREARSTIDVVLLEKLVGAVMETSDGADVEVQDSLGVWRLLRIRAYRTSSGIIDGAIVALLDIDVLKRSLLVAEEATRAADMLSKASELLSSSLDYETTLESLARLSTAAFADWCAVDLINDDGSIRHLTVSHANPVLRDLALQFQEVAFKEPERAPGAPQALLLRKSVLTDIAESRLSGIPPEAKIMQLIGALGVRSLISVPLIVRDKVLGTTTFSSSQRRYTEVDLQLAEELSQRAAVAIDTAMLFREAERANRYKDSFLGTVAHELRTPLTSIIGWVQLAKSNPDMAAQAVKHVDESATLLRVFIDDLLDVTRIREQKLSVDMAEIDFAAVVRAAEEMTVLSANGRGIQLSTCLDLDPAPVRGDRVRLLQVVWNLLSNAIKFTPIGGTIDVRLERAGNDAKLSVSDNGTGISAQFLPHVFELYQQGHHAGDPMPGLGIGLAIVAQVVKLHGGTARVESVGPDHGSTFIVTLPLCVPGRRAGKSRRSEDQS